MPVSLQRDSDKFQKNMDVKNYKKDEILFHAEKLLHYNGLLIEQCDSWLSAEEGLKNMEKRIRERKRKERKGRR